MEMINLQVLWSALRELKWSIDEAKNLVFNGKVVQCDRKLQGAQVRCETIMTYIAEVSGQSNEIMAKNPDAKESTGELSSQ